MENQNNQPVTEVTNLPPEVYNQFDPITSEDLIRILGQTIKKDEQNKLITFLACLSAYTEDSQINLSFNAPSSSGKSFIPLEVAKLFPKEDIRQLAYCSPTAFFHQVAEFNKETKRYKVDLSRKIIIFLDQPHSLLLGHLRPLLSHDDKVIEVQITDKSQKHGLRTKYIDLIGYPAVIFCTAGLNIDEQEATRFLLLSPEISQEKIRAGILEKIKKESDQASYYQHTESNEDRILLKGRIQAIREANIKEIKFHLVNEVEQKFFATNKILKPRHQRDIGRVISLIKIFALLNFWYRNKQGLTITANEQDVEEAFKLWEVISESQELNLPPYVYNLYKEIIVSAYESKHSELDGGVKRGLTRKEVSLKHFEVYGRFLPDWQLRQQIIPMIETAGLINQEPDPQDKRQMLIYPTTLLTASQSENNSESDSGVDENLVEFAENLFNKKT